MKTTDRQHMGNSILPVKLIDIILNLRLITQKYSFQYAQIFFLCNLLQLPLQQKSGIPRPFTERQISAIQNFNPAAVKDTADSFGSAVKPIIECTWISVWIRHLRSPCHPNLHANLLVFC